MFVTRIYIQVSDKRLRISSPTPQVKYESSPFVAIETVGEKKVVSAIGATAEALSGKPNFNVVNPFGHPRTVLGDFTVGEKLLQHALAEALGRRRFFTFVWGILHPERQLEGGLTQIEYRALREVGECAGCRKLEIYEGRPLTVSEVEAYKFKVYAT